MYYEPATSSSDASTPQRMGEYVISEVVMPKKYKLALLNGDPTEKDEVIDEAYLTRIERETQTVTY